MSRNVNAESEKDPAQLEREVDEQRAHIDDTLRALEERFSPGRILDQVMGYARSNSGDFSRNLVDSVKSNPVPSLLTVTGLLWMMYGQNRSQQPDLGDETEAGFVPSNASYGVDPAYEGAGGRSRTAALKEKGNQLRENAAGASGQAREHLHNMSESMHQARSRGRDRLHGTRENLRQRSRQASDGLERLWQDQPLALGALGIAVGALVGASMPRTQREDELMGQSRDQLAQRASKTAKEAYEKAGDLTSRVADDAKQEIESSRQQPVRH